MYFSVSLCFDFKHYIIFDIFIPLAFSSTPTEYFPSDKVHPVLPIQNHIEFVLTFIHIQVFHCRVRPVPVGLSMMCYTEEGEG